jgi:tetratricopeptide (TPR) repeat protein
MQRHFTRAIVLIALAAPLGACNSFLGLHLARHARNPDPVAAEASQVGATQTAGPATEAGRRQLADGQTGLAIESFQKALSDGEPIAPAVNGLGVAYARLGRFELALQCFQQALAADPADARYQENIARLMRSPTFAMRHDGDLVTAALKAEQEAGGVGPAQASNELPAIGRIQRVSRGEVRIVTVAPGTAPLRAAQINARFRPLVRVTFAEPLAAQPPLSAAHSTAAKVDGRFRPLVRVTFPEQGAAQAPAGPAGKRDAPR